MANPAAVVRTFPAAARLQGLYNGRVRLGTVVSVDARREHHAFDAADRPLGVYPKVKAAADAVGEAAHVA